MTRNTWSVSGICVTARKDRLDTIETILKDLSGIEVHASDPGTGKLVVTQEGWSVDSHQDGLRAIQALPGVLSADLVMHFEDPEFNAEATDNGGAA